MQPLRIDSFLLLTCMLPTLLCFSPLYSVLYKSTLITSSSLACGVLSLFLCLKFCFCISLSSPSRFFLPTGMFPLAGSQIACSQATGLEHWISLSTRRTRTKPEHQRQKKELSLSHQGPLLKQGVQWWAGRVTKGAFSVSSEKAVLLTSSSTEINLKPELQSPFLPC